MIMNGARWLMWLALVTAGVKSEATDGTITVYDCESPRTTLHAIDLTQPKACSVTTSHYDSPKKLHVEVLEAVQHRSTPAYVCQAYITLEVSRCGFDSLHYGTQTAVLRRPVRVPEASCKEAAVRGFLFLMEKTLPVVMGITSYKKWFTHGNLDSNSRCTTEDFSTNGIHYSNSYEIATLEYVVKRVDARVEELNNVIFLPDFVRAEFNKGAVVDDSIGTVVWSYRAHSCEEKLSKIYSGTAEFFGVKSTPLTVLEGLLMIRNNQTSQTAGFVIKSQKKLCGRTVYTTQTAGLYAMIIRGDESGMAVNYNPEAYSASTQAGVQRDYLYLASSLSVQERLAAITDLICTNAEEILRTQLSLAAGENKYSLRSRIGIGKTIITASAAAYIVRCEPVRAHLVEFPNCTTELPVRPVDTNQTMFADAFTMILSRVPNVTPCSALIENQFKIGDRWLCRRSGPPHPCPPPLQLDVLVGGELDLSDAHGERLGSGLYTPDQVKAHAAYLTTIRAREAVVGKLTYASTSNLREDGQLGVPLTLEDAPQFHTMLNSVLSLELTLWGIHLSTAFMILVMAGAAKIILCMILRLMIAARLYGCSWYSFLAIFDLLLMLLLLPVKAVSSAAKQAQEELEANFKRHHLKPLLPCHHSDAPLDAVVTVNVEDEEGRELSHRVSKLVTKAVHSRRQQFQDPV